MGVRSHGEAVDVTETLQGAPRGPKGEGARAFLGRAPQRGGVWGEAPRKGE